MGKKSYFIGLLLFVCIQPSLVYSADYVPNQILVKFKGTSSLDRSGALYRINPSLKVVRRVGQTDLIQTPIGENVERMVESLQQDPNIEYAELNYKNELFDEIVPSDPFYSDQWGMKYIQASQAWAITQGSDAITIAILDSGIDLNHPDLAQQIWTNPNPDPVLQDIHGIRPEVIVTDDDDCHLAENQCLSNNVLDVLGHGTHVSGIAAASSNNGEGITGISWNSKIMMVAVFTAAGQTTDETIARGIYYAVDHGAKIINFSGGRHAGPDSQTVIDAIRYAYRNRVPFVAAAGNAFDYASVAFPARVPESIAVAATQYDYNRDMEIVAALYTDRGPGMDIFAPGTRIWSTFPTYMTPAGRIPYAELTGTSMAAPQVAGSIALLLAEFGSLTVSDIDTMLKQTADPMPKHFKFNPTGSGRLNVGNLLKNVLKKKTENSRPFPNPYRIGKGEKVVFTSPAFSSGEKVILGIYDLSGHLVAQTHGLTWNGVVANGRLAKPGMYFYRSISGPALRGKLTIIK